MASPSERVLITGSSGFTGRALAPALEARGYVVAGVTRGAELAWEHEADLGDPAALDRVLAAVQPQVVVHLAGVASPVHGRVADIYEANVTGTAHLLAALRRSGSPLRLLVVTSSAVVYAPPADGRPLQEDAPLQPINDYGVSKLAVEQMCRLAARDLPIRVARPFNYTGPGQATAFLVPKIVDHFARDARVIDLGALDLDRDISDLRDTVEAYVRLVGLGAGTALNLCSGAPARLGSVVDMLGEISGRGMTVRRDPALVRPGEPARIVGDRTALDAAIGAWPRRTLRETLQTMYAAALERLG